MPLEVELRIYVSASPEMDAECELLGQLLADMPKSIRWIIKRTPGRHRRANPDIDALRRSHLYLILLGMDITAPVGVEWRAAQEAEQSAFAYRSARTLISPAAASFIRYSGMTWQLYQTPADFIQKFERAMITRLIEGTPGFGLGVAEIEELSVRLQGLERAEEKPADEKRRGAGRGGVILPSD